MNLLVGAAKRAQPLKRFHQPERHTGLLTPRALAHDTIRAPLGQRSRPFGYGSVAHDSRVFRAGAPRSSAGWLDAASPTNCFRFILSFMFDWQGIIAFN
jgi:hypothetical protein